MITCRGRTRRLVDNIDIQADIVCNHDLLEHAHREQQHAGVKHVFVEYPLLLQLRQADMCPHDRPGNKLRKKCNVCEGLGKAYAGNVLPFLIDYVTHSLEHVERYANRQHQRTDRNDQAQLLGRLGEEVEIFKNKQDEQQRRHLHYRCKPLQLRMLRRPGYRANQQQQQHMHGTPGPVEIQAGYTYKQHLHPQITRRKKGQEEQGVKQDVLERVKQHPYKPPAIPGYRNRPAQVLFPVSTQT